jgi:RNA polymerase sigma-70 factor (ECF subfamily)
VTQEALLSAFASAEQVEAARRGDRDAIEALVEAVWPGCYRVAFCVLGEAPLAEDAAQEACIALYRGITSLRDPASFNAWVYRIVVREAARARRRRACPEVVAEVAAGFESPAVDLDIERALATLSPALREVTVLYYFEDLASREIAAVLGVPDGTVRVRLMMARRKLRSTLTSYRELYALDDPGISDYAI